MVRAAMRLCENFLRVCSFWFLGDSFRLYQAAKVFYHNASGYGIVLSYPDYDASKIVIEGFEHSGNCFFCTNLEPSLQASLVSHRHRPWTIKHAVRAQVPTILLVRDPLEVAHSWYWRSLSDGRGALPLWVGLACWMGYYYHAWKYHEKILIVSFTELIRDYESIARKLRQANIVMNDTPFYGAVNTFTGARPEITLSSFEAWLLRRAMQLYQRYTGIASSNIGASE